MADKVPARVRWAVDVLDPGPDDHVLEVGGGTAASASLVCDRLVTGTLTAVDRSAVAAERIRRGNEHHVASGRLRVLACSLADLSLSPAGVDKAFSLNVNVFWTSAAAAELAVLARMLRPGGTLALLWNGAPTATRSSTARVLDGAAAAVRSAPFTDIVVLDSAEGCGVVARRT